MLGGPQWFVRLGSNTQCTRSGLKKDRVDTIGQHAARSPVLHALIERTALPERTLQQLDVAQSRSGVVGVQSLHSDLVALAVIVYVYIKALPHRRSSKWSARCQSPVDQFRFFFSENLICWLLAWRSVGFFLQLGWQSNR